MSDNFEPLVEAARGGDVLKARSRRVLPQDVGPSVTPGSAPR